MPSKSSKLQSPGPFFHEPNSQSENLEEIWEFNPSRLFLRGDIVPDKGKPSNLSTRAFSLREFLLGETRAPFQTSERLGRADGGGLKHIPGQGPDEQVVRVAVRDGLDREGVPETVGLQHQVGDVPRGLPEDKHVVTRADCPGKCPSGGKANEGERKRVCCHFYCLSIGSSLNVFCPNLPYPRSAGAEHHASTSTRLPLGRTMSFRRSLIGEVYGCRVRFSLLPLGARKLSVRTACLRQPPLVSLAASRPCRSEGTALSNRLAASRSYTNVPA